MESSETAHVEGFILIHKLISKKNRQPTQKTGRRKKEPTFEWRKKYPRAPDDDTVARFIKYCSRNFLSETCRNTGSECVRWTGNIAVPHSRSCERDYPIAKFYYKGASKSARKLCVEWFGSESVRGKLHNTCGDPICVFPAHQTKSFVPAAKHERDKKLGQKDSVSDFEGAAGDGHHEKACGNEDGSLPERAYPNDIPINYETG